MKPEDRATSPTHRSARLFSSELSLSTDGHVELGTPERNLLAAVLERAIADYVGGSYDDQRDAKWWFRSESILPYSFLWICEELSYPTDEIRSRVEELKVQGNYDRPKLGGRHPWTVEQKSKKRR